jgi:NADH:ubiquinone oxidoreductase subunit 6 (subunit J)
MPFNLASILFYFIAIVLVGASLAVVLMRNIVHAALALALVFGAAAGVYVLLNAEFIAIVQILIYAGAVTVLVLFAIMLTQGAATRAGSPFSGQWWLAGLICVILCAGVIYAAASSQMALTTAGGSVNLAAASAQDGGSPVKIGQLLYSPFNYSYVLPFEIASVLLLVAIVGAIVIAREE